MGLSVIPSTSGAMSLEDMQAALIAAKQSGDTETVDRLSAMMGQGAPSYGRSGDFTRPDEAPSRPMAGVEPSAPAPGGVPNNTPFSVMDPRRMLDPIGMVPAVQNALGIGSKAQPDGSAPVGVPNNTPFSVMDPRRMLDPIGMVPAVQNALGIGSKTQPDEGAVPDAGAGLGFPTELTPADESGVLFPDGSPAGRPDVKPTSTIGDPGAGSDGTDNLWAGVFGDGGSGWGGIKSNWKNMSDGKKQSIYEAMIATGGAMMTTPGNFGEGLGAGMQAGLAAYNQDEDQQVATQDADLKHDLARTKLQMAQMELSDPNISEARRYEAEADRLKAMDYLRRAQEGDFSSRTTNAKPSRLMEFLKLREQYISQGIRPDTADEKARSDVASAYGKGDSGYGLGSQTSPEDILDALRNG